MPEFSLKLSIKIPKICNCVFSCICKKFIKCKNNCICGNIIFNKQEKSLHSALTPDYATPKRKLRRNNSSVNFGDIKEIIVERLVYHSPKYFDNIRKNEMIKHWNLSPRAIVKINERNLPITPTSV